MPALEKQNLIKDPRTMSLNKSVGEQAAVAAPAAKADPRPTLEQKIKPKLSRTPPGKPAETRPAPQGEKPAAPETRGKTESGTPPAGIARPADPWEALSTTRGARRPSWTPSWRAP